MVLFTAFVATGVWYVVRTFPTREYRDELSRTGPAQTPDTTMHATQIVQAMPALGPSCGGHCGTERWEVKTLSDVDRGYVRLSPVDATVEQLVQVQADSLAPGGMRYAPVELMTYRVTGYLGGAFLEADNDWHLVLFGLQNQQVSLIAEVPDPRCSGACQSGFSENFARARQLLEERLGRPNPSDRPIVVTVTGVGFFDRRHGQTGSAPNNFELHPVLEIGFPD